ncbi:hypothetical protein [uncultured Roseobacter sp.]|uniref:hypothetical protein n=1 Tax=uncultured Roseobacter sp. TaxID=114847 RepID=UPI002606A68B|nr:hypothetical protein [uncultured Roseobacter sp.]
MESVFPKEVQAGLDAARRTALKRAIRLRVRANGQTHPVLRFWKTGFALDDEAPALRGAVDLYDGSTHLFQCLIVTSAEDAGERLYDFKRATPVADRPARDFVVAGDAPVGLIEDAR